MLYLKPKEVPRTSKGTAIREDETLTEHKEPQNRAGRYYSEMLLRQHPWLNGKLESGEYPIAFSYIKPANLLGLSLVFIGSFVVIDTLFHLTAFGSVFFSLLAILVGAALGYGGFWAIYFAKRAYVLVSPERVVHQKIDLIGRPGKAVSIPRREISRVRFLKSTVMYRAGRSDGGILIEMKNGKTVLFSRVLDGENIFGALR